MIDFYSLLARYWGVDRHEAKTRIIEFNPFCYSCEPVRQMQPDVMDYMPAEARAELLSVYGVILGEN